MVKIPAGEFKEKCLKIMNQVKNYHEEIIITKHGKPVAKLVPVEEKKAKQVFGFLKGTVIIHEDITKHLDEKWEVLKG